MTLKLEALPHVDVFIRAGAKEPGFDRAFRVPTNKGPKNVALRSSRLCGLSTLVAVLHPPACHI
jgi:hypothetical protein